MFTLYRLMAIVLLATSTLSIGCTGCMLGAAILSQTYRVLPQSTIVSLVKVACMKQYDSDLVCDSLSQSLTPIILPSVFMRIFNPEVLCGNLGWCPVKFEPLNITEEITRISNLPQQANQVETRPQSGSTLKILQLSDVHLDLDYREGYSTQCKATVCCHLQDGVSGNTSKNAGHYGSYTCDSPLTLLDSVVRNIKQIEPEIKLVLLTGDLSAHNEWHKSQETNSKIAQLVASKLGSLNAPVLLALGNNECYPDHQFDPVKGLGYKSAIGSSLKSHLTSEEQKTLTSKGYYSKYIESLGVRVIALNSLACDNLNFYLIANITDPSDQLRWLETELLEAERLQQPVYIISHISPAITECSKTWSIIYRSLSARFERTIKGHFYGHSHNDQFVVLTDPITQVPTGTVYQAPSLSPVANHEPSFRIYQVDSSTHQVLNYRQYSANLAQANLHSQLDMKWTQTYEFLSEYQLNSMSTSSISELQSRLQGDSETLRKYAGHFDGGHTRGSGTSQMYCNTLDDHQRQYECKGMKPEDDKMVYLLEMMQGQWLKRVAE